MDMQKSQISLDRLNAVISELTEAFQAQKNNFNQALATEKNRADAAQAKITEMETKLQNAAEQNNAQAEQKVAELQQELEQRNLKISGLQTEIQNLNTALSNRKNQLDELQQKYDEVEKRSAELQQMLTQTATNIDDVVAKLEKVLQENGASHNNN